MKSLPSPPPGARKGPLQRAAGRGAVHLASRVDQTSLHLSGRFRSARDQVQLHLWIATNTASVAYVQLTFGLSDSRSHELPVFQLPSDSWRAYAA